MNSLVNKYVAVVDEDEAVCQSLAELVESAGYAARTFASGQDFLSSDRRPGPCCLIVGLSMPRLDGFDLQRELAGRPEQIVFLTAHGDVPMCARAMKLGAIDFLCKPVDDGILLNAVSRALERSAAMVSAISDRETAQFRLASFTPRERTVFGRVIRGMLNKQIAADLGIAEKTIKIHRGRVMHKSGVGSVPDLVRLAIAAGQDPYTAVAESAVLFETPFTPPPPPLLKSDRVLAGLPPRSLIGSAEYESLVPAH